ncbi:MAG: OmpA family protein [Acidimicrobiia bacterium]|nr:OmpA family protein [Acidimicrobiia bacterium]
MARSNYWSKTPGSARRSSRRIVAGLVAVLIAIAGCTSSDNVEAEPAEDELGTESATPTSDPAEAEQTSDGEPVDTVVLSADFESPPGEEWSIDRVSTTPAGDRNFLGEFGNERVNLLLSDLGPHQAITVAFDLFVLRSWDSGTGNPDRWRLGIDGYRIIDATFSNDEAEQSFPDNHPLALNPPRSGAIETDSLGYTFASDDSPADSVYRIERTFLHDQSAIDIAFSAAGLQDPADQSWGIDNVEVIAHQLPERAPSSALTVEISGATATVTGTVGSDADRLLVERSLDQHFGPRLGSVELAVGDGPPPLWLLGVSDVAGALAPYANVTVAIDEEAASATGEVRTYRWREQLTERLTDALGVHVTTGVELDVMLEDALVNQVEGLRVEFPTGSAELDADDEQVLIELLGLLDADDQLIVRVDGHTDSVGTEDSNKQLSRARAATVVEYLLANGADEARVVGAGFGLRAPEVEELSDDDRATNRRVVFTIPRG